MPKPSKEKIIERYDLGRRRRHASYKKEAPPLRVFPLPEGAILLPVAIPDASFRRTSCARQNQCVDHALLHAPTGFACHPECPAYKPMTALDHLADLPGIFDLVRSVLNGHLTSVLRNRGKMNHHSPRSH